MFGWMMAFALLALTAAAGNLDAGLAAASISMKLTAAVFGLLFLACLLTSVVRRRV